MLQIQYDFNLLCEAVYIRPFIEPTQWDRAPNDKKLIKTPLVQDLRISNREIWNKELHFLDG